MTGRQALAVGLLSALGCQAAPTAPVDPVWGKEPCSHCAMLVSDKRFAAQLTTTVGRRHFFDDIGCMVAFEVERSPVVRARWVHDGDGAAWLGVADATFEDGARTPMDFGFVARATGGALRWPDVERTLRARLEKEKHDASR